MRPDGRLIAPLLAAALSAAGPSRGPAAAQASGPFDLRGAIAAAAPGALVSVPEGVYPGPVVIDRALELAASGRAVLDGGGEGDVVTVHAPDVTVRGFVIRNTGTSLDRENAGITVLAPRSRIEDNLIEDALFGIYLKGAEGSVIRGNRVQGKDLAVQRRGDGIRIWQSHGTLIEDNVVASSRDTVIWFSEGVVVRGNRVIDGRYGLHFMYTDDGLVEDNRLERNSVGAFLMYSKGLVLRGNVLAFNRGPSGYGVGLKDMDGTSLEGNLLVGNRVGLHLDSSPSSLRVHDVFAHNVFAYNDIGIGFLPAVKRNGFHDNAFVENLEQVAILGSGELTGNDFAVGGRGNYWSDYRGWDESGDGIGDLPYVSESLFESLVDRQPLLRLFLFSPAQQAVEMAAATFPVVRPRPKLRDEAPLLRAPAPPDLPRPRRSPWPMGALAAGLLCFGSLSLAGGRWRVPRQTSPPPPPASAQAPPRSAGPGACR